MFVHPVYQHWQSTSNGFRVPCLEYLSDKLQSVLRACWVHTCAAAPVLIFCVLLQQKTALVGREEHTYARMAMSCQLVFWENNKPTQHWQVFSNFFFQYSSIQRWTSLRFLKHFDVDDWTFTGWRTRNWFEFWDSLYYFTLSIHQLKYDAFLALY